MSNEASDYILNWLDEQASRHDSEEGILFASTARLLRSFRAQAEQKAALSAEVKRLEEQVRYEPFFNRVIAEKEAMAAALNRIRKLPVDRNTLVLGYAGAVKAIAREGLDGLAQQQDHCANLPEAGNHEAGAHQRDAKPEDQPIHTDSSPSDAATD